MVVSGCSDDKLEDLMKSFVKAPPATIEHVVKGHEQIHSVQAILRMSQRRADDGNYAAYDITQRVTPIPVYQEIDFDKDDRGNVSITSKRKTFDVVKGKNIFYALELKYYDVNGQLINHQFSNYDAKDEEGSTLVVHQHFFTIQNYSLDGGAPLTYPMTLDSVYYDRFLFETDDQGQRIPSTRFTPVNVYAPVDHYQSGTLRYDLALAVQASERSMKKEAEEPVKKGNTTYRLFKTIDIAQLNRLTRDVFTYEYRDTDPVEEPLGSVLTGYDDMGRVRTGTTTIRLHQKRSLNAGDPLDALGFKGMLQFHQSDMCFQMRVCICHIITANGKYMEGLQSSVHAYNDISPAWNSFDIDYPVPFRVIADADGNQDKCMKDIQRFYPGAKPDELKSMLWGGTSYFEHMPQVTM